MSDACGRYEDLRQETGSAQEAWSRLTPAERAQMELDERASNERDAVERAQGFLAGDRVPLKLSKEGQRMRDRVCGGDERAAEEFGQQWCQRGAAGDRKGFRRWLAGRYSKEDVSEIMGAFVRSVRAHEHARGATCRCRIAELQKYGRRAPTGRGALQWSDSTGWAGTFGTSEYLQTLTRCGLARWISLGAAYTYTVLVGHADGEGRWTVSYTTLADEVGITERAVKKHTAELKRAELLTWRHVEGRGAWVVNEYQIRPSAHLKEELDRRLLRRLLHEDNGSAGGQGVRSPLRALPGAVVPPLPEQ